MQCSAYTTESWKRTHSGVAAGVFRYGDPAEAVLHRTTCTAFALHTGQYDCNGVCIANTGCCTNATATCPADNKLCKCGANYFCPADKGTCKCKQGGHCRKKCHMPGKCPQRAAACSRSDGKYTPTVIVTHSPPNAHCTSLHARRVYGVQRSLCGPKHGHQELRRVWQDLRQRPNVPKWVLRLPNRL